METMVSISVSGSYSSAMTALKVLQHAKVAPDNTGVRQDSTSNMPGGNSVKPAAIWSIGNLEPDHLFEYGSYTSRTEHGDALMQKTIDRMDQAEHTDIRIKIDGKTYDLRSAADKLTDHNIGLIAKWANQVAVTDEEFETRLAAGWKKAATVEGASEFNKMAYQAYIDGRLDIHSATEFGIQQHITKEFEFSSDGEWISTGGTDRDVGSITNQELFATRVVRQEDGTFIDPETGRYAHFSQIGDRAVVSFFDPLPEQ